MLAVMSAFMLARASPSLSVTASGACEPPCSSPATSPRV